MDATESEILSHIQDRQDRRILSDLLKKHEVLRVRLLVKPPGLETDRAAIEHLQKRLAQWDSWYKANEARIQEIYKQNKELRAKVADLEEKMERLLREWNPPATRKLFQGPAK